MRTAVLTPECSEDQAEWPWWAGFVALLVALAVAAVSLLQGGDPSSHPLGLRVLVTAIALLPWLDMRARVPTVVLGAVLITAVAWLGWHHSASAVWFLMIFGATQTVASRPLGGGAVVIVAALGVVTWESVTDPTGAGNWVAWYVGTLASVAGALGFRRQRELLHRLGTAQAELARQSALGERQRIAREIHDVIAHSLTVTMLHLTAARLAVRSDPDEAEEALLEAERVGRQSLADVRRTVDLLRTSGDGDQAIHPPLPGASDITALVGEFAAAGLDVGLRVQGEPALVPPAAGLGLYRIAQESLANAVKHAPGSRVTVELDINASAVSLQVHNSAGSRTVPSNGAAGSPQPGGFGLGGMAQRAALLGGSVEAAPAGDGWQVAVRVPLAAPAVLPDAGEPPQPASPVAEPAS